jgi:hypothetical protein
MAHRPLTDQTYRKPNRDNLAPLLTGKWQLAASAPPTRGPLGQPCRAGSVQP